MASQPERIAKLEEGKKLHWRALGIAALAAAAWSTWLTTQLAQANSNLALMAGDVRAIKQKIADGGVGPLVSALQNPKSPEQLAASLAVVSSQIRVAQVDGRHPDEEKLLRLSAAVKTAATRSPNMAEAWQAAYQIVNFRSSGNFQIPIGPLLPCWRRDDGAVFQL